MTYSDVWQDDQHVMLRQPKSLHFANRLVLIGTFLFFLVSPYVFYLVGWRYLGGGTILENIHIGSYVLVVAFSLLMVHDIRFRQHVVGLSLHPSFAPFLLSVAALAVYAIIVKKVSIAPFVDTFFATFIAVYAWTYLPPADLLRLRRYIDVYFAVSVAMLFIEYAMSSRIIPPTAALPYEPGQFRSAALFEGPLSAATELGIYVLVTLFATPMRLTPACIVRLGMASLSYIAIFTTGGRTSLGTCLLCGGLFVLFSGIRQLIAGRVNRAGLIYMFAGVPISAIALVLLWQLGVFDTVIARFQNDIGSAYSRQVALELAFNLTPKEQWFGMEAKDVAGLTLRQRSLGLIAIEISWVNFVMVCGLIFTIPMFIGFLLFLFRFIPRVCAGPTYFVSLFLLINVSASNGIWSKTSVLTISLAIMLAFLRRDLHPEEVQA